MFLRNSDAVDADLGMLKRKPRSMAGDNAGTFGTPLAPTPRARRVHGKTMKHLDHLLRELITDENGNSVTEYAMIIAVTVVFVMVGITTVEHPISDFFASAGDLFDVLARDGE